MSFPQRASSTLSAKSIISLTKPFTPSTLHILRNALKQAPNSSRNAFDLPGVSKGRSAAVLIPFCNVGGEPGILLEIRAKTLRSHSGEISFPGGRIDDTDESLMYGALRETHEELGIQPNSVEILGEIGPPEVNLRGDMKVWPFVGFIHSQDETRNMTSDEPLPSLDLEEIRRQMSPTEVAAAIHLPLKVFASPIRLRPSIFRGHEPYWAIDVTDLIPSYLAEDTVTSKKGETVDEVGPGVNGRIEVWGLTGWYLSLLLKVMQVYR